MKKLNTLLSIPLKSIKSVLEKFNRDSFEDMIDSLAITNYSINKGSYMLFW
jgi:hypothetical protein